MLLHWKIRLLGATDYKITYMSFSLYKHSLVAPALQAHELLKFYDILIQLISPIYDKQAACIIFQDLTYPCKFI